MHETTHGYLTVRNHTVIAAREVGAGSIGMTDMHSVTAFINICREIERGGEKGTEGG